MVLRQRPELDDTRAAKESLSAAKMIVADEIEGALAEHQPIAIDAALAPRAIRPLIDNLNAAALGDGEAERLHAFDLSLARGLFPDDEARIARAIGADLCHRCTERLGEGADA